MSQYFNKSDYAIKTATKTDIETVNTSLTNLENKTMNISQNGTITTLTGTLNTLDLEIGATSNSILGKNCGNAIADSTGLSNTIIGYESGKYIATGDKNTIFGCFSSNSAANSYDMSYSVALGYGTNAIKSHATSVGAEAHASTQCTSIGRLAGNGMWSQATNNLCLGYQAGSGYITNQTNKIYLGNDFTNSLYCNTQSISALSDARDKIDIENLDEMIDATDYIENLNPKCYRMNNRNRYRHQCEDCDNNNVITHEENDKSKADNTYSIGMIAQEVQEYEKTLNLPNSIMVDEMNENTLSLSYSKLIPILVQALKESNKKIELLDLRLELLENLQN